MPSTESYIDNQLGIQKRGGQWNTVESYVDEQLGIIQPQTTDEKEHKKIEDILRMADEYELPVDTFKK